ncbi:DUF1403 family protein [Methylocystis suflitae]|uniref:DUF1403 family protein n=1 Tax=Methylocystis suflitae TaxID=2951405 RepID=UPI00210BE224|nr:DUF1403 family protein [Methylocystis suflitae]MCQ4191500.1 DUF1403 family protein [Methylocystis suflitae]
MFEADSSDSFELDAAVTVPPRRGRNSGRSAPALSQYVTEIQPLPRWARRDATAHDAPAAAFLAGANLLALDQILRSGDDGGEPVYVGALRQRLALKAAATCARLARLREDDAALRDAEHLSGAGVDTSPAGRVHRLWRLFVTRPVKFDATTLSVAIEYLEAQDVLDVRELADALRDVMASANDPLAAAAGVSAAAMYHLPAVPAIDAEIFALWLADAALAQKLGWQAPVALLATVIAHPTLRREPNGRRPRPDDRDWSNALASAYALAAGEAMDLAAALSRQTQKLLDAAPKLRAKGALRVIDMLVADDCVAPARAAKYAKLSDRGARRLFDRLTELGAVREVSGRANFRLYGL